MQRERDSATLLEFRAQLKSRIEKGVESGLHIFDAASAAGVSPDMVLANIASDNDFRRMWELSRGRARVTSHEIPDSFTPADVKSILLDAAVRCGGVEKIATVIALADPATEEGKKDLKEFAMPIFKDHLPRETVVKKEKKEVTTHEITLEDIRQAKKEIEEMERQVIESQRSLLDWEEDDGHSGEEGPSP